MKSADPATPMTPPEPSRWDAMWAIFDEALAVAPADRPALLAARCGQDQALRAEVEEQLAGQPWVGDFLESSVHARPAVQMAWNLQPGTDIGRYIIERHLDDGGMGVVYRATQKNPRRRVALKLLRPSLAANEVRRRYRREAEILGRLEHPWIARLIDADVLNLGDGRETPYLVMEFVDGPQLLDSVHSRDLSIDERLELLAKICDAVHYAHQRGVLHCDLKPSNIKVTADGQPKVLDFGVARFIDDDAIARSATSRHAATDGTMPYMSPERFTGDPQHVSVLIDVYSLGVLGYELLAGRLPFNDLSDRFKLMQAVGSGDIIPLGRVDERFKGDIADVIHLAMDLAPEARYQTAGEFAAELRRIVEGEPVRKPARSRTYQIRKFVRRHRAAVAAACVLILTLVTATGVSTREYFLARAAEERSERNVASLWSFAKAAIFKMHDGIAPLPGSTPVRRDLVDTARTYLEQIRSDAGDDPAFLLDLALAYERLGDVTGNTKMFSLGDVDAARTYYDTALSILEPLASRYPDDLPIVHALGRVCVRRAEAAAPGEGAGKEPGLIPHLERGVELLRRVVARSQAIEPRLDLMHALVIDGWERESEGDAEAMIREGQEALRIGESLVAQHPGDERILFEYNVALSWQGEMLIATGRFREAAEQLEPVSEWFCARTAAHPEDPRAGYFDVLSRSRLGRACFEAGDFDEGLRLGAQAVPIAAALAAQNSEDQRIVRSHEISVLWLAEAHLEIGDDPTKLAAERLAHYEQAAELFKQAIALLNARAARGWLPHWESDYPTHYAAGLGRCEVGIKTLASD